MCGICGIISTNNKAEAFGTAVKAMADCMRHRGPDDEGLFCDTHIAFGHRRLSILDVSAKGHQPMADNEGQLRITFNGEIYNFGEIKKQLAGKYAFTSGTDTETILAAYREWGTDCVKKFRGMFAFALYDSERQVVVLARDHFGQKPLYYHFDGTNLFFSSEINALAKALPSKPDIDRQAVLLYLLHNYRHIPDPHTIYSGISKLPPASLMVFDIASGKMEIVRYWRPDFKKDSQRTEAEWLEEYRALAKECVGLTTVSDVPIGILLSGGVDSSTIAALLPRTGMESFALGCRSDDPELLRARQVAGLFKTTHHEFILAAPKFSEMEELIGALGEPLNLLAAIFSRHIAKAARERGIKVLIGGNGADEMFYGYDGSNRLLLASGLLKIFGPGSKIVNGLKPGLYRKKAKDVLGRLAVPEFAAGLRAFDAGNIIEGYAREANSPWFIEKSYYAGLMSENQHSVTIIGDLTGMMHSVEIRTPFLDPKMFEFAARLPVKYKVGSLFDKSRNKYLMRKAMEGLLPNEIVWGKKMGFGYTFSLAELIRTTWQEQARRHIFDVCLPELGFFDREEVERLWQEHQEKRKNHSAILWGIATLGIWYRRSYAQ